MSSDIVKGKGQAAAIATRGLSKKFEELTAVEDLSLEVAPGEVFGFLGPNGAGKTTTVRMLAALIAPSAGEAWVGGLKIGEADSEIRRHVGLLTESPGLYEQWSPKENLLFFAQLYGMSRGDAEKQIESYLRRLDLWERRDDPVSGYSKGMKQKVALARALVHRPSVVFLDEPSAGLDPESTQVVHSFIEEMRSEQRTIFLCTHNLDEAQRLCDRVAIFRHKIIRVGSPVELRRSLYGRQVEIRLANAVDTDRLVTLAKTLPFTKSALNGTPGRIVLELQDIDSQVPQLVHALDSAGAQIWRVAEVEHSLESAYLDLVKGAESASGKPEDGGVKS